MGQEFKGQGLEMLHGLNKYILGKIELALFHSVYQSLESWALHCVDLKVGMRFRLKGSIELRWFLWSKQHHQDQHKDLA